jgi:hypothetical protein
MTRDELVAVMAANDICDDGLLFHTFCAYMRDYGVGGRRTHIATG